jgi:ProP effector
MAINTKINQNAAPTLALLKSRFPDIFVDDAAQMRPLKIGIHKDLFEAFEGQVTRMSIRGALALYTSSPAYKPVIQPGVARIGLDGQPCGVVEAEYQDHPTKTKKDNKPRHARPEAAQKRRGTVQHPTRRGRARKQEQDGQQASTTSTRPSRPPRQGHPAHGARPAVVIRTAVKVPVSHANPSAPSLSDELKNDAAGNRPIIKLKKRRKISPEDGEESSSES